MAIALKSNADQYGTVAVLIHCMSVDRKPGPMSGSPRWQERTAQVVHVLFYIVILGTAASGIGMIARSGAAPMIFCGESALLPDFWRYPPRLPHAVGARLLMALFVLHAAAAVYHHFVRSDDLLWRMWFSKRAERSVTQGEVS
jgi:cytochrome b561